MAKKVKRKVSSVSQTGAARSGAASRDTATAEMTTVMPAEVGPSISTPAPRTFGRRVSAAPQEFNPDYTYVKKDLKRIGTLAGSFFVILIALSFILPLIIK